MGQWKAITSVHLLARSSTADRVDDAGIPRNRSDYSGCGRRRRNINQGGSGKDCLRHGFHCKFLLFQEEATVNLETGRSST